MSKTRRKPTYQQCALQRPKTLAIMKLEQHACDEVADNGYQLGNRVKVRRVQVTTWDDCIVSAYFELPRCNR